MPARTVVPVEPGQRFGRWTVVNPDAGRDKPYNGMRLVLVRCECGTEKAVRLGNLRNGDSTGCDPCNRGTGAAKGVKVQPASGTPGEASDAGPGGRSSQRG
jgi:hypothetical protein